MLGALVRTSRMSPCLSVCLTIRQGFSWAFVSPQAALRDDDQLAVCEVVPAVSSLQGVAGQDGERMLDRVGIERSIMSGVGGTHLGPRADPQDVDLHGAIHGQRRDSVMTVKDLPVLVDDDGPGFLEAVALEGLVLSNAVVIE